MTRIISFNATGRERRRLADEIGNALNIIPCYLRLPTCAYQIGECILDRDGALKIPESVDSQTLERILTHLEVCGFSGAVEPERDILTVSVPLDSLTEKAVANLKQLTHNKSELLKRAFNTDSIDIKITSDAIEFPWFQYTEDPDAVDAYTEFISRLCDMAKSLKYVRAGSPENDNDKYAFRCFLLRLGFIGAEHKIARRILLRNLTGNSAFRHCN